MKKKMLKAVLAVLLSMMLVVPTAMFPVQAAGYGDEGCKHVSIQEYSSSIFYPNITQSQHQIAEKVEGICLACKEKITRITYKGGEAHSFGADGKCSKCGYAPGH